jgi:hypothetical protein
LASRKSSPGFKNVSLKRQISTPCCARKCSSSSFLPRTPSEFEHARRRALTRSVLLGRAAILVHEEDNGFQDSPRTGCPCGQEGDRCEEPTGQLLTCLEGEVVEEIRNFLEYGGGSVGWSHQLWGSGFGSCAFDTRSWFPFRLPSGLLRGRWRLGLRLFGPGCLSGGGHLVLLGQFWDRVWGGFGVKGAVEVALTTRPPRTTWFQPSTRSLCSAEGLARCAFGAADWPEAALFCGRWGNCFARDARASFHLTQPQ